MRLRTRLIGNECLVFQEIGEYMNETKELKNQSSRMEWRFCAYSTSSLVFYVVNITSVLISILISPLFFYLHCSTLYTVCILCIVVAYTTNR